MKAEVRHIEYEVNIKDDLTCIGDIGDFDHLTERTKEYAENCLEDYIFGLERGELIDLILDNLKFKKVWFEIIEE